LLGSIHITNYFKAVSLNLLCKQFFLNLKSNKMKKSFLLIFALGTIITARSQNILQNSDFTQGFAYWDEGFCSPEIFTEDAYGGPSSTNLVTEIDFGSCIKQSANVTGGTIYSLELDATRRTTCGNGGPGETPPNPGIKVSVIGVTSGTVYSTVIYNYANTTWTGYTHQTQPFLFPLGTTDAQVRVEIVQDGNPEFCGIVLDNVTMAATGVLPVNLISFNAASKNNTVDVSWVTNSEVNTDHFVVFRSKNGTSFTPIATVNASGFVNGSAYTFNDAQPGAGVTYYRLQMVDKNASTKVSGIVKVNFNTKNLDVAVYPSIVTSVLNYAVESPKAEKLRVMVSDVTGKRIISTVESFTSGTTQKSINVSTLASGVYLLTIMDDSNAFKKSVTFKKD
jgi:hypothetical protein